MIPQTGRFRRTDRLLDSRDFQQVGRGGRRGVSRYFVFLAMRSEMSEKSPTCRLGVTVSRRVGNAVVRNRIKRRIREWFRRNRSRLEAWDALVVIARPGAGSLEPSASGEGLERAWCALETEGRA